MKILGGSGEVKTETIDYSMSTNLLKSDKGKLNAIDHL